MGLAPGGQGGHPADQRGLVASYEDLAKPIVDPAGDELGQERTLGPVTVGGLEHASVVTGRDEDVGAELVEVVEAGLGQVAANQQLDTARLYHHRPPALIGHTVQELPVGVVQAEDGNGVVGDPGDSSAAERLDRLEQLDGVEGRAALAEETSRPEPVGHHGVEEILEAGQRGLVHLGAELVVALGVDQVAVDGVPQRDLVDQRVDATRRLA